MILNFDCKETEKVSLGQYSKLWNIQIRRIALRRLDYLDSAINLKDLKIPPSNRLHPLKDDLKGFYSISINMKWRIIFIWKNGNAYKVKITNHYK
ncbi:MAG: type II toxin-antitoxin system RelE/ParE family toxin [Cyclobacteriaceae bacterium]|nr:type II toxin-antitoxin system RelE/ParE family toxin [Cyclobacteriaceae bacterium]